VYLGITMPLTDGDAVPMVTFKCRVRDESIGGENPFTFKDVTTADIMAGKRVVIFAVPGAFTPTCSDFHLPGYEKQYDNITAETTLRILQPK
jgi:thioredoxin-dependent peroxiredoxin